MAEPEQPYADAVASLMDQGYRLEDITEPEVVQQALDQWLRKMIEAAIAHHAASGGNGHQADELCDGWYALQDALQLMHDNSRPFLQDLLEVKP